MRSATLVRLRGAALVGVTVVLGISWSFSLLHVQTRLYPVLWAAAMPLLAWYYATGAPRAAWRHLPAAALSVYALVLWRSAGGYGLLGGLSVALGVTASLAVFWYSARWAGLSPRLAAPQPRAAGAGHGAAGRRRTRSRRRSAI